MEQELILLSIINTQYITQSMIAVYEASGFLNFDIFNTLYNQLPDTVTGNEGYNTIYDNSQYHPYIFYSPIFAHFRKYRLASYKAHRYLASSS